MTFPFTLFANRHAHGASKGAVQTTPYVAGEGFDTYLATVLEAQDPQRPRLAKDRAPLFVHGVLTNGLRDSVSLENLSAMTLDCDGCSDLSPVEAFLRTWPHQYLYQYRWALCGEIDGVKVSPKQWGWKYHLVFPFAEPIRVRSSLRQERAAFRTWLTSQTNHTYDPSQDSPIAYLYFYSPRPDDENLPVSHHSSSAPPLPWDAWLSEHGVAPDGSLLGRKKRRPSSDKITETDSVYLQAFEPYSPRATSKGYEIDCPLNHSKQTKSKTMLFLGPRPYIVCFSDTCANQPFHHFLKELPDDRQDLILDLLAQDTRKQLTEAAQPEVTLEQAQAQIRSALGKHHPVSRTATLIRVTPGAGKSHAVLDFLKGYTTTRLDEEGEVLYAGRTAVLATPTNALGSELATKLNLPHRRRVGVLAVLNDDGSPACKKHTVAQALQAAGGNVHRLMCSKCEYREGCPARDGVERGDGPLTVTNHTLMPSVAQDLFEKHRHPYLVWDECPPVSVSTQVPLTDLRWLLTRFDTEAAPVKGPLLDRVLDMKVFPENYRVILRPLLAVLGELARLPRSEPMVPVLPEDYAAKWGRLPLNEMMVDRALTFAKIHDPPKGTWDRIRAAYEASNHVATPDTAYDALLPSQRELVLKAHRILEAVALTLTEDALVYPTGASLMISALSPSARLFRDHGGVILDATASVAELRALAPRLTVVDIRAEDAAPNIERTVIPTTTLSKAHLKHRPRALNDAVASLKSALRRIERDLDRPPKTVCFTYLDRMPLAKVEYPEFDWHYFRNVRGYDRWFQEGYDVFVTFGDPVTNLDALALRWAVLFGGLPDLDADSVAWGRFVQESGAAETAQAHGRARDPQAKKTDGGRYHFHFGRVSPLGWDLENAGVDPTLTPRSPKRAVAP